MFLRGKNIFLHVTFLLFFTPCLTTALIYSNSSFGYDENEAMRFGLEKQFIFYYEVEFLVFLSVCLFGLKGPRKKYLLHFEHEKPTRGLIVHNSRTNHPSSNIKSNRVFILIN